MTKKFSFEIFTYNKIGTPSVHVSAHNFDKLEMITSALLQYKKP